MSFIYEQKINGRVYLYRIESYWDKDKKQARQKRTYIGPKELHPRKKRNQTLIKSVISRNYGNILFLDTVVKDIGLEKILSEVFPDSYKEILGLCYYEIMEGNASFKYPYWIEEQYMPDTKKLHSGDISKLYEILGISQKERMEFIRKWTSHIQPNKGIYYDITSISGYSTNNDFLEWGYNRDKENLPQINIGIVCCQQASLPFFYQVFPGSISDVSTLKNQLKYYNILNIKNILNVQDKGFCSLKNILDMHKHGMKFIQPLPFSWKKVKDLIAQNKKEIHNYNNVFSYNEEILSYTKTTIKLDKKNFYAHIYLNEKSELEQRQLFLKKLLEAEAQMKQRKITSENDFNKFCEENISEKLKQYFCWDKRTKQIKKNQNSIDDYIAYLGYIVFLTNQKELDKTNVLSLYRNKDIIEKIFDVYKNEMDGDRLRVHSKVNMDGKLFVKFITLIIYMKISRIMNDSGLFDKYSLREMLLELRKIKITHIDNHEPIISEVSKKQREILQKVGLSL